MKIRAVVFLVFAAAAVFHLLQESPAGGGGKGGPSSYHHVVRVYDGDTVGISVRGVEERIRLIGIDAPEMGMRPWGARSKGYLEDIIGEAEGRVLIEHDAEERDQYDRLLGYLHLPDGRFVNEQMLKRGLAVLYTIPPNVKYVERLRAAQTAAREQKVGIWGKRGLKERPSEYRRKHPRE